MMTARRIEEIEVLRAAAIGMVMIEHMPFNLIYWRNALEDFTTEVWNGGVGVDLFFVISGYVIARGLLPRLAACASRTAYLTTTLTFLLHRLWRLQPAAWLWLLLPLVATALFNRSGAFHTMRYNLAAALASILAVNNVRNGFIADGWSMGLYFPYWSLSLEEQFYLLLPAAALLRGKLAWVMAAALAYQFVMPATDFTVATRPGALAVGVLLAIWGQQPDYAACEPRFLARGARGTVFLTILLVLLGFPRGGMLFQQDPPGFALVAVLAGILVYTASFDSGYLLGPGAARRLLVWVGARSYALYLAHIPCYALAREIVFRMHPPSLFHGAAETAALVTLGVSLTIISAVLSHRFVELPARRYGRSLRIAAPEETPVPEPA